MPSISRPFRLSAFLALLALAATFPPAAGLRAQEPAPMHGIAMHGDPAMPADYTHLPYADPDAPKGGELVRAGLMTSFDSLNPYAITGRAADGLNEYYFPQMMARSWDEPFSLYGYVAETIMTPPDRSWVEFQLNPAAEWHDGTPITVDDVIFSMEILREQGTPAKRRAYGKIVATERVGERGVRFTFEEGVDRETALLMGLMPVLKKDWWDGRDITRPFLETPPGGGPYRIESFEPGRFILYERVEDWWGAELPYFNGQMNFDRLRYDFYRDESVELEAFKAGAFNYRIEFNPERWITAYDFPAAHDGRVTMMPAPHGRANGMRGFVFNTRRPFFQDPTVREALTHAFDFEAVNRAYLAGQYERIDSFFDNSELAATGLPEGAELALLEPYRDELPPEIFTEPPSLPATDGSGNNRRNLRTAAEMLNDAGWIVRDGVRVNAETGEPLAFEILLSSAADERVALAFTQNLDRLGVQTNVRTVDSAEYVARLDDFSFDMIIHRYAVSLSPGTEQYTYWGSRAAEQNGTRNYAGVQDPVVDAMIDEIINAVTAEELEAAVQALDRVLLAGHYVVPLYFTAQDYIAYWGDLGFVDHQPLYGQIATVDSWWREE